MDRFTFLEKLGDGAFGSVMLAICKATQERVAIKSMKKKYYSWNECLGLREVKSLKKLKHKNIVKLQEVIRENDCLHFVFEYMVENLYTMIKEREVHFQENTIRKISSQILQGLVFMHRHGYFHRDLKPENILCSGEDNVKIADFGLARETRSKPPYTDYVSTRWYRAPEVLLRSTSYNSPVDMWALGCIMAEMYTLSPLYPGSSEIDQLFKITSVLGTPTKSDWMDGHRLSATLNFRWPQLVATPLKQIVPNSSDAGIEIMSKVLKWDPMLRLSSLACSRMDYFDLGDIFVISVSTPKSAVKSREPKSQSQVSFDKELNMSDGRFEKAAIYPSKKWERKESISDISKDMRTSDEIFDFIMGIEVDDIKRPECNYMNNNFSQKTNVQLDKGLVDTTNLNSGNRRDLILKKNKFKSDGSVKESCKVTSGYQPSWMDETDSKEKHDSIDINTYVNTSSANTSLYSNASKYSIKSRRRRSRTTRNNRQEITLPDIEIKNKFTVVENASKFSFRKSERKQNENVNNIPSSKHNNIIIGNSKNECKSMENSNTNTWNKSQTEIKPRNNSGHIGLNGRTDWTSKYLK